LGGVLHEETCDQQERDAAKAGGDIVKASPKGLFRLTHAKDHLAGDRVEVFISRREKWARQILEQANIELPPAGKERAAAQARPFADAVHQALETIHFARRLRHSLGIAKQKGVETGFQAIWATELAFQLCIASTSGEFITIEPAIKFGMDRLSDLAVARQVTNATRRAERLREWGKWQSEANEVWTRRPTLKKNATAGLVKKNLALAETVDLIARRIKKPGKAG
jgi:hypothetical protein